MDRSSNVAGGLTLALLLAYSTRMERIGM